MANDLMQSKVTPLFNRILCTMDFGSDCLPALRLGRRLAERNGATLSIIHVMSPQVPGGVVLVEDRENARVGLERIVVNELTGIDYHLIVRWGNPVKEIVAAETELGVDLCVMPTDGRLGASHIFRRSITERVARESPCPVITVGTDAWPTKETRNVDHA